MNNIFTLFMQGPSRSSFTTNSSTIIYKEASRDWACKKSYACREFLFPTSFLLDEVKEYNPYCGTKKLPMMNRIIDVDVTDNAITNRMFVLSSSPRVIKFRFSYVEEMPRYKTLQSFKIDGEEELMNKRGEESNSDTLEVSLDPQYPHFDTFTMQCCATPEHYKRYINYLEISAKRATVKFNGKPVIPRDGTFYSIGEKIATSKSFDKTKTLYVHKTECVTGPVMISGIGMSNFPGGFLFQLCALIKKSNQRELTDDDTFEFFRSESSYTEKVSLVPAGITNYNYFESNKPTQRGYTTSDYVNLDSIRNHFREIAVEDKEPMLLFQKLPSFRDWTPNPISRVLPTMVMLLDQSFSNSRLAQSVIRITHIESDKLNLKELSIWQVFAESVVIAKKFILERPSFNTIQCAALDDDFQWGKVFAMFIAASQVVITYVLVCYILFYQCGNTPITHVLGAKFCLWQSDYSMLMSFIATVLTILKVHTQMEDTWKFRRVFSAIIKKENVFGLNNILFELDRVINVGLAVIIIPATFFFIAQAGTVSDLVMNVVAITFVVELDEELNFRDQIEILDLVRDVCKSNLISHMEVLSSKIDSIDGRYASFGREFIKQRLTSASYSSNDEPKDVKDLIIKMVDNVNGDSFFVVNNATMETGIAADSCPRKLYLVFSQAETFSINEGETVYFRVLEDLVKSSGGPPSN